MAEYDEDDHNFAEHNIIGGGGGESSGSSSGGGGHHNRTGSKFHQFQNMLGTTTDDNNGQYNYNTAEGGGGGGSGGVSQSQRTSRCYSAQTRTVHRSSHPSYNEEFRFEVADDTLLQDEPLLFHVWDIGETSSPQQQQVIITKRHHKNHGSSIGLVYIDLNPLLMRSANYMNDEEDNNENNKNENNGEQQQQQQQQEKIERERSGSVGSTSSGVAGGGTSSGGQQQQQQGGGGGGNEGSGIIDGWFPLYDTLGGVRGELCLSIKLNFIGDKNPFRDSSAGVQLFPFSTLDSHSGYIVAHVFGFVEELVVADDPEFQWSDNFNQARTSHETRQTLMYLLDAKVRRRMCKKVLEMGGNAVLAYRQNFDFEGDSLTARTFGTCVLIQRKETKEMVQFMANNNPKKSSHRVTKSSTSNELTHHHHHDESPHKEMARNTGMVMTLMNEATSAARQREDAQEVAVS